MCGSDRQVVNQEDPGGSVAELSVLSKGGLPFNVLCFRYVGEGLDEGVLDRLNQDLLGDLHESGIVVVSSTSVRSAFVLRLAITNHRTQRADLPVFVSSVLALGDRLAKVDVGAALGT